MRLADLQAKIADFTYDDLQHELDTVMRTVNEMMESVGLDTDTWSVPRLPQAFMDKCYDTVLVEQRSGDYDDGFEDGYAVGKKEAGSQDKSKSGQRIADLEAQVFESDLKLKKTQAVVKDMAMLIVEVNRLKLLLYLERGTEV